MTQKRQRGRKWAMLEAVATAMLHGWRIVLGNEFGYVLRHDGCAKGFGRWIIVSRERGVMLWPGK